jgi:hypothetical protein
MEGRRRSWQFKVACAMSSDKERARCTFLAPPSPQKSRTGRGDELIAG